MSVVEPEERMDVKMAEEVFVVPEDGADREEVNQPPDARYKSFNEAVLQIRIGLSVCLAACRIGIRT